MTTLKDISKQWELDSQFDVANLANEANATMKLHSKYLTMLIAERVVLKKMQAARDQLFHYKTEYLLGRLSRDELKELGWEPLMTVVLKSESDRYLSADSEMVKSNEGVMIQNEKVEYLKSIMDQIKQRGFLIKSALDWIRYTNGA